MPEPHERPHTPSPANAAQKRSVMLAHYPASQASRVSQVCGTKVKMWQASLLVNGLCSVWPRIMKVLIASIARECDGVFPTCNLGYITLQIGYTRMPSFISIWDCKHICFHVGGASKVMLLFWCDWKMQPRNYQGLQACQMSHKVGNQQIFCNKFQSSEGGEGHCIGGP